MDNDDEYDDETDEDRFPSEAAEEDDGTGIAAVFGIEPTEEIGDDTDTDDDDDEAPVDAEAEADPFELDLELDPPSFDALQPENDE